jgi:hypothetical protein
LFFHANACEHKQNQKKILLAGKNITPLNREDEVLNQFDPLKVMENDNCLS